MKIVDRILSIFRTKNNNKFSPSNNNEVISKDILISIPRDLRQQEIYFYLLDNKIDFGKEGYDEVNKLKKGHQMIYLIWHLQGEVNNGGYYQFFDNFENCNKIIQPYYDLISEHLKIAKEFYNDFINAIDLYEKLKNEKNEQKARKYDKSLFKLDMKFYKNEYKLIEIIDDYIDSHLDEFVS